MGSLPLELPSNSFYRKGTNEKEEIKSFFFFQYLYD
jgi:hypothetical protein